MARPADNKPRKVPTDLIAVNQTWAMMSTPSRVAVYDEPFAQRYRVVASWTLRSTSRKTRRRTTIRRTTKRQERRIFACVSTVRPGTTRGSPSRRPATLSVTWVTEPGICMESSLLGQRCRGPANVRPGARPSPVIITTDPTMMTAATNDRKVRGSSARAQPRTRATTGFT